MRKLALAFLALVFLSTGTLAQSNVRPIYDNTGAAGSSSTPVDLTHGLPVQIVTPGGTPSVQPISTPATIRVVPAAAITGTASAAYASGNVVGSLITFNSATRCAACGGIIQTVVLRDKAGQSVPYDLFLFDATPTTPTDKTAVALASADLAKAIGTISLSGITLGAAATMGLFTYPSIGQAFKLGSGTTMYGILVTRGAPVYATTTDLSIDLVILPD